MELIENFLRNISYKFPKGYPDMNDPKDILLLETITSEIMGYEIKLNEKFNPLEFTDLKRPGRESRITKISDKIEKGDLFDMVGGSQKKLLFTKDEYKEIFNKPDVEKIKSISGNKINTFPFFKDEEGNQYGLKDLIKTQEFGGKGLVVGAHIEDRELENLMNQIIELGQVDIKLGNKIYKNISKGDKPKGNPKADFVLYDTEEQPQIYISHKDIGGFQQFSGINVFQNHPEVKKFVDDVRELTNGILGPKTTFQRNIEDDTLKVEAIYGHDKEFGLNKVQIVCQGAMKLVKLEDGTYEIKSSHDFIYPEIPSDIFKPKLLVTYRQGMNQQKIQNARFGIYPYKFYPTSKPI